MKLEYDLDFLVNEETGPNSPIIANGRFWRVVFELCKKDLPEWLNDDDQIYEWDGKFLSLWHECDTH